MELLSGARLAPYEILGAGGMESGFRLAEAFVHHDQSPFGRSPDA